MTQAPPTLEYQRLERARKTAIGGLRLLGILISILAAAGAALTLSHFVTSFRWSFRLSFARRILMLEFLVMIVLFGFGLAKFLCALFIARRSRAAAIVALCIVLVECAGLGLFWLAAIRYLILGAGYREPVLYRAVPSLLMSVVLLGWLAVAYEILHVLRHEKRDVV
jgi:hypothetical protein